MPRPSDTPWIHPHARQSVQRVPAALQESVRYQHKSGRKSPSHRGCAMNVSVPARRQRENKAWEAEQHFTARERFECCVSSLLDSIRAPARLASSLDTRGYQRRGVRRWIHLDRHRTTVAVFFHPLAGWKSYVRAQGQGEHNNITVKFQSLSPRRKFRFFFLFFGFSCSLATLLRSSLDG